MFKIVLWDYTGEAEAWAKSFLSDDVKIIRTLKPDDPDQAEVILRGDWNFVLIFEDNQRELFNEIFKTMHGLNVSTKNIVFARDFFSLINNPVAVHALLKPETCENLRRHILWREFKNLNAFNACTAENVSYIAPSTDAFRMEYMFANKINWASHEMKRFYKLSQKYYNIIGGHGYFLDLGANIGTTGIYFLKNLTPNLKLLAFEPDPENFKMHRLNIILNDLEDRTTLVNCGLGNAADELMLYRNDSNSGANGFIKHQTSTPIAKIKVIALDSYFAENKMPAAQVKYIWIDTEGFEAQVIVGMKNLLKENPAPIFMECNLRAWDNSGLFEDMLAVLAEKYSHFIHFWKGETLYPIESLRTLERPNNALGQCGDIFLIRKGAID